MIVIVSGRQTGKTVRLLKMMADNPEMVLVSAYSAQSTDAFEHAKKMGLDLKRDRFISTDARENLRGRGQQILLVDNAEFLLQQLLGQTPEVVTMTGIKL
jgi:hypothetical protein